MSYMGEGLVKGMPRFGGSHCVRSTFSKVRHPHDPCHALEECSVQTIVVHKTPQTRRWSRHTPAWCCFACQSNHRATCERTAIQCQNDLQDAAVGSIWMITFAKSIYNTMGKPNLSTPQENSLSHLTEHPMLSVENTQMCEKSCRLNKSGCFI